MTLNQKIIKPKLGLLELAKSLGNVSAACKTIGYSRDSYYRFKGIGRVYGQTYIDSYFRVAEAKLVYPKDRYCSC
jgi:hypothetical protein